MRRLVLTITLCATTSGILAEDAPELTHNPFARPDMAASSGSSNRDSGSWPEALRATLVDGVHSLANIDGTLVTVGESVDGATVTHIAEGMVTLTRGETTRTLRLDDEAPTPTRRSSRER